MSGIFREKALKKQASREQLDRMLIFIRPLTFLAVIGGIMVLASVGLWGCFGTVPEYQDAFCIGTADESDNVLLVSEEDIDKIEPGMKIIFSNNLSGTVDSVSDHIATLQEIWDACGSVPDEIQGDAVVMVECTSDKYIEKDEDAKILLGETTPLRQWISWIGIEDE